MAGGVQGDAGGIGGLLYLLREHTEAFEYDLITLGLRLDDLVSERLSWWELKVLVMHSGPDRAVHRALNKRWRSTDQVELLRSIELWMRRLYWQRTQSAKQGRDFPEPILWPWEERPANGAIVGDPQEWDDVVRELEEHANRYAEADPEEE